LIEHYFASIRIAVGAIATAHVDYYLEQARPSQVALLELRLSWPAGELLQVGDVLEPGATAPIWLRYRYHFQSNTLVLRYDNAPHHPELPTHPEHRHRNQGTEATTRPSLLSFLDEVRQVSGLW